MRLEYKRTHHISIYEPNFHISEGVVDIVVGDEDGGEHVVGRASLDLLDYYKDRNGECSLFDVCDADSAGWEHVFSLLFDPKTEELLPEISCDTPFEFIAFVYDLVLLPEVKQFEPLILHHLGEMHGSSTIFTMYKNLTDLPESSLADLRFKKIAGSPLLFRTTAELTKLPELVTDDFWLPGGKDYSASFAIKWDNRNKKE